jgi:hypothetical protein
MGRTISTPCLANTVEVNMLIAAGILINSSTRPLSKELALITRTVDGRICVGGVGTHYKPTKDLPRLNFSN